MLDIPPDHKNIIYSFLDIKSLIQLGSTCKTFHNDKGLILRLVQKVVDSYFFCSSSHLGIIHSWLKFPYIDLFNQIYIDQLKKISFEHLELVKDSTTNKIESIIVHQQTRYIEIKDPHSQDYNIHIFMDAILSCTRTEKTQIYLSLFQFIGKILSVTIDTVMFSVQIDNKGLNVYLRYLGLKIYGSLREMFQYEKDRSMKKLLIMEMDKFSESLSKSAGEKLSYFKLDNFISVNYDDYIRDVIEIGEILLSLNKKKEFKTLYDEFVADFTSDMSSTLIKKNYYELKMNYYHSSLTYEKKLCELLKQIDINPSEEIWLAQIEDIVKTHS
jgi:hypothetical protein